ncbi:MAG: RluA family pseudouridine synthase [Firmicutes bacterium]|nr:RluA family pseudouridine synthase [Bacillota bacterium]
MKHLFNATKNFDKVSAMLSEEFFGVSKNRIISQIKRGEVRINGVKIVSDCAVSIGDEVRIFLPESFSDKATEVKIIYEDDNVLVVDKPVLCEVETHLVEILKRQKDYDFIAPSHRLDRNTTGLVVLAKSPQALEQLFNLFKHRKVQKFYKAEVVGKVKKQQDSITVYFKKHSEKSFVSVSDVQRAGYMEAITEYKVIKYFQDKDSTELEIKLITGRTHQIRATLAHIGHSIIGDGKYGSEKLNRLHKAPYQKLRAYKIIFDFENQDAPLLIKLKNKEISI